MKLAGDLAEFSLADLLQVKSAARQTAGLKVLGPEGNGLIVLHDGEVVDARYEELVGESAFHALMGVKAGYFEAATVTEPITRTIDRPVRELLLDAFRLAETGELPRPTRRTRVPSSAAPTPPSPALASPAPAREIPLHRASHRREWLFGLLAAAVLALAGVLFLTRAEPAASGTGEVAPSAAERVVEATSLKGPGDRLPELLSGKKPRAPRDEVEVLPTIVCRLRVSSTGSVVEAKVYRSRLEFARFEELAVSAVEAYRFHPALEEGKPVAVWLNLPVEFE